MKAKNAETAKKAKSKKKIHQIPDAISLLLPPLPPAARLCNKGRPRRGKPQINHFHGRNRENYKELPSPKVPDPDGFTTVLHQIIKHQIIPKRLELFKSIEKERKCPSSFFEVNILQIFKPDKNCAKKKIEDQYH